MNAIATDYCFHMKVSFKNNEGINLAASLDIPKGRAVKAYAIFAHCFTCSKNLSAVRNISRAMKGEGIAVLRFDFTGLGNSEGDFSDSNFSSNVEDLLSAASFLEANYAAPKLLIGHSLGGAAVLFAAGQIPSVEAVATIGAPFGPGHVQHMFDHRLDEIEKTGAAEVNIGGRPFLVKKQFVDDIQQADTKSVLSALDVALLILHSPQDRIVEIDNASKIYLEAMHPKSFVSLDGADHLLSDKSDSLYVGKVISAWASRYINLDVDESKTDNNGISRAPVTVVLQGSGFTTEVYAKDHAFIADEPVDLGGQNLGPGPFDLLLSSLGTCTAMTLRMYADRKKWPLEEVKVHLRSAREDGIFKIYRALEVDGDLDAEQTQRLQEIADKCPVHKAISGEVSVVQWTLDKET